MTKILEITIPFIFLNTVFIGGIFLYSELPRVINVMVVFFVGPLALMLTINYAFKRVLPDFDSEGIIIHLGITVATLWIATALTLYLSSVPDFVAYLKSPVIAKTPMGQIHDVKKALYFEITGAKSLPEYAGTHTTTFHKKNAFDDKVYSHQHYAVPLVPSNWKAGDPVDTWITESVMFEKYASPNQPLILTQPPSDPLHAIKIHDPYEIAFAKTAMEQAWNRYNLKSGNDVLVLKNSAPATDIIASARTLFFIIVLLVNALWLGIPFLLS
jgi:hypothetical protein